MISIYNFSNVTLNKKNVIYEGWVVANFFAILSLANFEQFYDYKPLDLRISGLL